MRLIACAITLCLAASCSASVIAGKSSLQRHAQEAFRMHSGGAVVMRVSDGRVLAIVNPNISAAQLHSPGSIIKLTTAFAALQEGLVTENSIFTCAGQRRIGDARVHCTTPKGHGKICFSEAIAQSCNLTFYDIGMRLGPDRILKYAREFGLDRKIAGYSGIQSIGHLPSSTVHPADTARLAIGQADGFQISLLEAAEMVRGIANGNPKYLKNLNILRKAMRLAVTSGTCKNASVADVEVAGKTGTTEAANDSDQRSGWFVGFAPYKNPEIVVVVFVNRGHGYDTAAPIAQRIFSSYFGKEKDR